MDSRGGSSFSLLNRRSPRRFSRNLGPNVNFLWTPAPNFTKMRQPIWSMILSQAHGATEGDDLHTRKRFILRKGHLNLNSWNGPFWDPNSPSVGQEVSLILWKLKDHSRVRNSLQRYPVHTNLSYFYRANLNIISHVRLGFPNGLSDFPIKTLYAFLFSSKRGTRPTHMSLISI